MIPGPASGGTGALRPGRGAAGRSVRHQPLVGWSFALPFVALFVVFLAGPILVSFLVSFTDFRVTDIRHPFSVDLVGLDNYARVLSDPGFRHAAANTALYVMVTVPLTMGLGLAVAVALNQEVVRFRALFRLGYFLPYVTSIVAVSVVWRALLGTEDGLINGLLAQIGIEGPGWLTDPGYALGSIMAMTAWRGLGLQMVVFLSGLQAIPPEVYEAASVDGAGPWQRFRLITLPLLRPTLLFSGVVASIGLVQFFEEPFVLTRGGPLDATVSVAFEAYDQFSFGNYGYTAAISYVLFTVIVALTLLQFRLFRSRT